jgi:phosphoribosylanthranilate isomerase
MRIKICGITNLEDATMCQALGVDAIGFIFYPKSPRYINPQQAGQIIRNLHPFLSKIGVFVNESAGNINKIAKETGLDAVQLHGEEKPGITGKLVRPVIKAFRVNKHFEYALLKKYTNCSILLDSFSKMSYGGTGIRFDWELIPFELRAKIILAGGISEENISEIVSKILPTGIDISSSIEEFPGKKDHSKLIKFMNKVNKIRYSQAYEITE